MHSSRVVGGALAVVLALAGGLPAQIPAPPDAGAGGAWQALLKLRTTASLLHVTAHPDDEQGAMLARVSRREGAWTGLLTLNRGEAGDNAIGPELFDALGLIRTEELALAGRYYGLDAQYFTAVADYGYSKRLDEALEQWDRQALLGDMVRAIRASRPLVVVSRWQGNERDGHGQHQAAGALTPEAVRLAGDPDAFPELARDGLRPWRARKLYVGGVREQESWQVKVDAGEYDPVLGASYQVLGRFGLSLQRSQTGGRFDPLAAPLALYYRRVDPPADASMKESGFFDGLETRISDAYRLSGGEPPAAVAAMLAGIEREVDAAVRAFQHTRPSASAPALARGLAHVREALAASPPREVAHLLENKARQFTTALVAASGFDLRAVAEPPDAPEASASPFAPPPVLGPVTAGQTVRVRAIASSLGSARIQLDDITVRGPAGTRVDPQGEPAAGDIGPNLRRVRVFSLTTAGDAPATRPYFVRRSIAESRYTLLDPSLLGRPSSPPPFVAAARARIEGVPVEVTAPVVRRESNVPYGYELRTLEILPALGVALSPGAAVVPLARTPAAAVFEVTIANHSPEAQTGEVRLEVPAGATVRPAAHAFTLQGGADARMSFRLTPARDVRGPVDVRAVATAGGRSFDAGVQVIRHRDLPLLYLFRPALGSVRPLDVRAAPGLEVGYVMGAGDDVPGAITQLGARVRLLGASDLASGNLDAFDTIVTGTRAYAVRADLRAHNRRLLEYVKRGGNLVVLYNTPELVPREHAPYPADLPGNAEEVAEERAPVEILVPAHPLLTTPNRITTADFDGWIEQRGSKFFAAWDAAYTPLVSSNDRGQAPQRGGLLHARYGRGHYTYMAYALHRQLPYGVPGAYRLLANLLSLGRVARAGSIGGQTR